MKRPPIAVLALAVMMAACGIDGPSAPGSADESITAPTAAAGANSISQTICSSPLTTEVYDAASGQWLPAYTFPTAGTAYNSTIPGSMWLEPVPGGGRMSIPGGDYFFRTSFELPADFKNATLNGGVNADNWSTWLLNGVEFFTQPHVDTYANFQYPPDPFQTKSGFVAGTNDVLIDLYNIESSSGVDYCFTVNYMSESESGGGGGGGGGGNKGGCPAAPAIAVRYLISLGLQPTSVSGKNIIALVAQHMTQGGRFDTLDRCDERYAPAVIAFIDRFLAAP